MSGPLRPPRLAPGGTVGVAALSGPVRPEALAAGVARLEGLGYRVRVARNATAREPLLGLAGSDEERLAGYEELLRDEEVTAIVLARGGYGIGRLLPRLDPALVAARPVIHCGFSDATALHAFLLTRCGLASVHGPMVAAELAGELDPLTARYFPAALEGTAPRVLEVPGADVVVPGAARGRLVGGCLSLLSALVGAPEEFDYRGAILLLEEVAEEAYRVDRMLGTLARAGRFDKLAGILVGSMDRITFGGAEDPERLRALLAARFAPLGVPVALGLPFGHTLPNVALPIGATATWDGTARTLLFEEDAVW